MVVISTVPNVNYNEPTAGAAGTCLFRSLIANPREAFHA
jgi:hypothetical protein